MAIAVRMIMRKEKKLLFDCPFLLDHYSDPSLKRYGLGSITGFELVPAGVDETTLSSYKEEFELWIVGCGLREMMETFNVFLDEAHHVCRFLSEHGQTATADTMKRITTKQKEFTFYPLNRKLEFMSDTYKVALKEPKYLTSINVARNCLTHRRGIVRAEDCSGGQELVVYWKGFDFWVETPAGERTPMELPLENPILVTVGSRIEMPAS